MKKNCVFDNTIAAVKGFHGNPFHCYDGLASLLSPLVFTSLSPSPSVHLSVSRSLSESPGQKVEREEEVR